MTITAFFVNPRVDHDRDPSQLRSWLADVIFSREDCQHARAVISQWPGYEPTPLRSLDSLAGDLGVEQILYKDESDRFGLKSFKALGGAFAVYTLLADEVERRTGTRPDPSAITSGAHADIVNEFTVASATAGNHGRSIAWGAQQFGCPAVIYVHAGVSDARAEAISGFGAQVVRVDGNYDASVRAAAAAAKSNGWTIVSDTSYPGYQDIPRRVMLGYTVMLGEILDALEGQPPLTHVVIQAGVGGLAAAVAAHFALYLGRNRPRIIIVEPERADCLYQSAQRGSPTCARGGLGSLLLGLDCGEVSLIAWQVLDQLADAFVLISDEAAIGNMRQLNRLPHIVAGECSGAGLTVLEQVSEDPVARDALGLCARSRVLLFGTEGDTDPEAYQRFIAG